MTAQRFRSVNFVSVAYFPYFKSADINGQFG